jgi:DNA-directed RNA polymerase specialized sigma24 family protein
LLALSEIEPRTMSVTRVGRAVTPNEAADVLAVLYPALLRFAEKQLRSRHLDHQLAEDLVQEAGASWFATGAELRTTAQMSAHLRTAITNRAVDLQRKQVCRCGSLHRSHPTATCKRFRANDPRSLDGIVEQIERLAELEED